MRAKYHHITRVKNSRFWQILAAVNISPTFFYSEFPDAKRRLKKVHEQPGIKTNSTLNFPQSPVQIHVPSTACDVVTFLTVKDNCVC